MRCRMRFPFFAILFSFIRVAAVPVWRPTPKDPNRPSSITNCRSLSGTEIIKSIEFEGNRKFKAHVLRERLGFQLGDRLDPFLAEGGRVTIMEVYRKVGYPSVKVTLDRDRPGRRPSAVRHRGRTPGPDRLHPSSSATIRSATGRSGRSSRSSSASGCSGPPTTPRTPSKKTRTGCGTSTTTRATWTTRSPRRRNSPATARRCT